MFDVKLRNCTKQVVLTAFYTKFELPEMHFKKYIMDSVLGVPGTVISCCSYLGLNALK